MNDTDLDQPANDNVTCAIKSGDPTRLDQPAPLFGLSPLALLAALSSSQDISPDERDAGEHVARLASFVYSRPAADGATHIPTRDADGRCSNPLMRGQAIKARLEAALAAVRTDSRRKAVTLALIARDRSAVWADTSALSCGLEDLSRHFWGAAKTATVSKGGVTLAAVTEDATPERLVHANDNHVMVEGVRRIVDSPFARMHARRQLDPDSGINDILFSAGRNYFQSFYYAGLGGIAGIDYSRIGGGGSDSSPAHLIPKSEFALHHRQQFRSARVALGERYREVVDPIVLEDGTVTAVAAQFRGTAPAINAIAKERLNVGLRRLAVFYGLMRDARAAA